MSTQVLIDRLAQVIVLYAWLTALEAILQGPLTPPWTVWFVGTSLLSLAALVALEPQHA